MEQGDGLTLVEAVRQVVLLVYPSPEERMLALSRRSLRRGERDPKRGFRRRKRETMPILRRAIQSLTEMREDGTLERADREYQERRGCSSTDLLLSVVYTEYLGPLSPPPIRRTKTEMFGSVSSLDLEYGEWEL